MTLADVRSLAPTVAVLPMGATEPHNLHLPYGTDSLEAWHLARRCCQRANEQGGRVIQLPVVPYGTESNLQAFPLAMNLQPTTVGLVLRDLVESLANSNIHRLLIFNSHGGNDLKPVLRELYGRTPVNLFLCNWYQMIRDLAGQICEHADDHAGEMETSLILAFRPDLVQQADDGSFQADEGRQRQLRFQALREGWVTLTRPWHLLTTNSGSGNPHAATADKGRRLGEAIVQRVAPFLVELSGCQLDSDFPFA
ncbi:MAG: creatininase family protein [Pirellulaceae bacterium]|nr:creatininase family protein [Pirellulaceae bacterium]